MTKDEIVRIEKQRLAKVFHELDEKAENDTKLVDRVTRPLFR